jgi:L-lactate dehydrogenase complex protein LldF
MQINRVKKIANKKATPAADSHTPETAGTGHVPAPFKIRYKKALKDGQQQRNLLNFQRAWRVSRDTAFEAYQETVKNTPVEANYDTEFDPMRQQLAAIKDNIVENLPDYVAEFKEAARRNGITVYEAATKEEACNYVYELCRAKGIDVIVKSKSMVSEEIGLNAMLEERGIHPVETDLGEWIAQLDHERPSHMVLPVIHKSRQQVGNLFRKVTRRPISLEDVNEQVKVARHELQQDFLRAGMGISGANALIAQSGAVLFIENEGNARLVTTAPRVHVVLAGIEKLLPNYEAAMLQLRLLARSATAQQITSYTTFTNGPAEPGKEMHIVLLDNGRTAMRANPDFKEALRCIRCGACANVCPPYQVVGGHVFGHIYTGAIGLVNTPFHHGVDAAAGPQSLCVSCNACQTVCPVNIPLPRQILDVRALVADRKGVPLYKRPMFWLWSRPHLFDLAFRAAALLQLPFKDRTKPFVRFNRLQIGNVRIPFPIGKLGFVGKMTSWRTLPAVGAKSGRATVARRMSSQNTLVKCNITGKTVAYFVQCLTDRLYPDMAQATVEVLEACGAKVVLPHQQHCCGLLAVDSGDIAAAKKMAQQTIVTLEQSLQEGADYPHLFADAPDWKERARKVASQVYDFVTFIDHVAKLPRGALALSQEKSLPLVTYHNFCQSGNVQGIGEEPYRIIRDVLGREIAPMNEANVCCGFGGSVSLEKPELVAPILNRKLDNATETGAAVLVADNPGCIMHMRGGVDAQGRPLRVLHLVELMAEHVRQKNEVDYE